MKRAIFLDRDGVLNRNILNPETSAYESPLTPGQLELLPNVIPALWLLRDAGYLLFIVSNQPNYAKGKASMEALDAIHSKLETALGEAGIAFNASYYCFHHPSFTGPCTCRKPSPYFLFKARDIFKVELEKSWMIGDRTTDVECGRFGGTRTVKIGDWDTFGVGADLVVPNLWSATQVIVSSDR
jgi:D-glycero-D-manno-heptose 1,7-bisphosphate phosphatase